MLSRWARSTFMALNQRDFRLLFLGTTFAQMAFAMMSVVQGVVAFQLTGKNASVGLVALGMGVAMLILSPVGGALGDRRPISLTDTGGTYLAMGGLFAIVVGMMWLMPSTPAAAPSGRSVAA